MSHWGSKNSAALIAPAAKECFCSLLPLHYAGVGLGMPANMGLLHPGCKPPNHCTSIAVTLHSCCPMIRQSELSPFRGYAVTSGLLGLVNSCLSCSGAGIQTFHHWNTMVMLRLYIRGSDLVHFTLPDSIAWGLKNLSHYAHAATGNNWFFVSMWVHIYVHAWIKKEAT